MDKRIKEIFTNEKTIKRIQDKLPGLFHIAELESSRAGKIGMEEGSLRERIIVALMIYNFGENNVNTDIPISEPEVDVMVFNNPISIKTKTGTGFSGVKLIWTVDAESALNFQKNYKPTCDMIFIQIIWNDEGYLSYIPIEVQNKIFTEIGSDKYVKLPKQGTNPRGAEITAFALNALVNNKNTLIIPIHWKKEIIKFNAYNRWIELWQQD